MNTRGWMMVLFLAVVGCGGAEEKDSAIAVHEIRADAAKPNQAPAGPIPSDDPKKPEAKADTPPAPGLPAKSQAKTVNEKRFKVIEQRPPETEEMFRKQYGERPRGILFVQPERRFYTYCEGQRLYWNHRAEGWDPGQPDE